MWHAGAKEKDQSCHHKSLGASFSRECPTDERVPPYNEVQRLHLKDIRHVTTAKKEGPLKRKRPFAHVKGHQYDLCFHEHRVERFQRRH